MYRKTKNTDIAYNDMFLFNFELKLWESVEQFGFKPEARWNGGLTYDSEGNKLYIFGGSNLKGYCKNDLYCFEMNQDKIKTWMEKIKHA